MKKQISELQLISISYFSFFFGTGVNDSFRRFLLFSSLLIFLSLYFAKSKNNSTRNAVFSPKHTKKKSDRQSNLKAEAQ